MSVRTSRHKSMVITSVLFIYTSTDYLYSGFTLINFVQSSIDQIVMIAFAKNKNVFAFHNICRTHIL